MICRRKAFVENPCIWWALTLLLVVGACAHQSPGDNTTAGETTMTNAIKDLCRQMSADRVDAMDVAKSLGDVSADPGDGMPIQVTTRTGPFSAASVARESDGQVARVTITPSKDSLPLVTDLRKAFGKYRQAPMVDWKRPLELVFEADLAPGRPFACTLIVAVDAKGDVEGGTVRTLTLRRDIRL